MQQLVTKEQIEELLEIENVHEGAVEELNEQFVELVEDAEFRAAANGRRTVMERDV